MAGRLAVLFILLASVGLGQFGLIPTDRPVPQARTREELRDFGLLYEATWPEEILALAERFENRYLQSEFLALARTRKITAYEQKDDFEATARAARQVLALNPRSLEALIGLARVRANQTPQESTQLRAGLDEAERLLNEALEILDRLRMPRTIPTTQWIAMRHRYRAQALELMGVVQLKLGRVQEAIARLKEALTEDNTTGSIYYRLGMAYLEVRRMVDARIALEMAVSLGPEVVSQLATRQLVLIKASR